MATVKKIEACIVFAVMLIAWTVSIPIDSNGPSNKQPSTVETFESREDMMIRYRLPNNTVPILYKISIEPDMEADNFTWIGEIVIDIEVLQPTSILTLHAYENLVIDENSTELVDANDTKFKPIAHSRDNEVEFLKVEFDHEISVGNYSLNLKYEGRVVNANNGFYKISFGTRRMPYAGTHFEATVARQALPCWDEPAIKARFRMSIKHFPNYTAVSNMPEIDRVETANGKILTTFDTTPIMSTYLLTFVIAEYGQISNEYGNVTFWASEDQLENVKHVLNFTSRAVEVMEKYTGLSYGIPRIGSALLPLYNSRATEHWGLVTYDEEAVKFDRSIDTHAKKDWRDITIAHELSHAWFGNRVTPVWWDDLWLKEAFASYFEYYILDEIYDNWGGAELFVLQNNYELSFHVDHFEAIPVKWNPITNVEIRRLFRAPTYFKGAAIIYMFRNVLTDDVFRAGIRKFLTKHSYGSANADDMMRALQEAHDEGANSETPLNVKETMSSWLVQRGYPIVNVTRNYTTGVTKVAQESALTGNDSINKWWIPLSYATQSNLNLSSTVPSAWIGNDEDSVTIDGIGKNDWVIFNVRASGYYRVNYDLENWNRITDYLNTDNYKNIHVLNRAQLINDAGYMANRDPERYCINFYKLTKYLSREVEYLPWRVTKIGISRLAQLLQGTAEYENLQKYIAGLMSPLIEKVGFEERDDDDHLTILSRAELVDWACAFGHSKCSEFAAKKLLGHVENGTYLELNREKRDSIICAGLRGLNDTDIKKVVAWGLENERGQLVQNFGCTKNHDVHRDFLIGAITKNSTEALREMELAFDSISKGGTENFDFAVTYFLQNHEAIKNLAEMRSFYTPLRNAFNTIVSEVKTTSRFKKIAPMFKLDSVIEEGIVNNEYLDWLESEMARRDKELGKVCHFWYQQSSIDNTINSTHPEPR